MCAQQPSPNGRNQLSNLFYLSPKISVQGIGKHARIYFKLFEYKTLDINWIWKYTPAEIITANMTSRDQ